MMGSMDDGGLPSSTNFAGVGVQRLQLGDDSMHSMSTMSSPVMTTSTTRSEWFPHEDDQSSLLSHTRLSCGRFPRFAKVVDDPYGFRVATPTPVLQKPRYNHFMIPPDGVRTPPEPLDMNMIRRHIPAPRQTKPRSSSSSQGTPKRPQLTVQTLSRNNGHYQLTGSPGMRSAPTLLDNIPVPKPQFEVSSTSPSVASLGAPPTMNASLSPVPSAGFAASPEPQPGWPESRDMWDSATTSTQSLVTPTASVDARFSPPSAQTKQESLPERPSEPRQNTLMPPPSDPAVRQSALDAIDAFMWNDGSFDDSSEDESIDGASRYSTVSYATRRQTHHGGPRAPSHMGMPRVHIEPAVSDTETVRELPNILQDVPGEAYTRSTSPKLPTDEAEDEKSDADDLTVEAWLDSRLSADLLPTDVPISTSMEAESHNPLDCRRCHKLIQRSKLRSADGKLSGVYHPECFQCTVCPRSLRYEEFYVFQDEPYCYQHYHEKCDTLCATCQRGIEGIYREANGSKYHEGCFTCTHVDVHGQPCGLLLDDYYDLGGRRFCGAHAHSLSKSAFMDTATPNTDAVGVNLGKKLVEPKRRRSVLVDPTFPRMIPSLSL